jgi:Zn-dependent protease with chaperone function
MSVQTFQWQVELDKVKTALSLGDLSGAEAGVREALSCAHSERAPEQAVADIFFLRGVCLERQDHLEDANRAYSQALRTYERACGPESKQAIEALKARAHLAFKLGQSSKSKEQFDDALKRMQSSLGADHQDVLVFDNQIKTLFANGANHQTPSAQNENGHDSNNRPQNPPARPTSGETTMPETETPRTSSKISLPRQLRGGSSATASAEAAPPGKNGFVPNNPIEIASLVHHREKIYTALATVIGVFFYGLVFLCLVGFVIAPILLITRFVVCGLHLGSIRGKSIKVSADQFPEIHEMVEELSWALAMPQPDVYIVNENGLLNAFAKRLHNRNLVILCSDVVEMAYTFGRDELAFVLCHELAHIKRGHVHREWLYMPADLVPFLGSALSRAREYTCDRIAQALVPTGALYGLVSLSAGTQLFKRVNLKALYDQQDREWNFWTWFSEIQCSHPNLVNRIRALGILDEWMREKAQATVAARR